MFEWSWPWERAWLSRCGAGYRTGLSSTQTQSLIRSRRRPSGVDVTFQELEEARAGNLASPQAEQVLACDLAIDEADAFGREPPHQGHESDLRGVWLPMKHRLAAEAAADANTVDSSDQLTIPPALHAMGVTKLVEPDIGLLHLGCDPGSFLCLRGTSAHALMTWANA